MKKKASHHQKDVVIAEIDAKTNNIIEKGDKEMAKKVTKKEEINEEEKITTVEEAKEEITSAFLKSCFLDT